MTTQQDVDNRRMVTQQSIDEGKLKIDFSDVKREIDKITSEYKPTKKVTANRNRKRGRKYEKELAERFQGLRQGLYGGEDVAAGPWSIEAKTRKKFTGQAMMEQAIRNCPEGKCPIVVLHIIAQRHSEDIVMMRLGDFEDWWGKVKEGE